MTRRRRIRSGGAIWPAARARNKAKNILAALGAVAIVFHSLRLYGALQGKESPDAGAPLAASTGVVLSRPARHAACRAFLPSCRSSPRTLPPAAICPESHGSS